MPPTMTILAPAASACCASASSVASLPETMSSSMAKYACSLNSNGSWSSWAMLVAAMRNPSSMRAGELERRHGVRHCVTVGIGAADVVFELGLELADGVFDGPG